MVNTSLAPVSVAVIDDEPLARRRVVRLLEREPTVTKVVECADGGTAVETIVNRKPDVVFLDVQMPDMNGFEVIEAVGAGRMPAMVLTTGHGEYAVRAFEVEAADYLLKPFSPERFRQALQRAVTQVRRAGETDSADPGIPILQSIEAKQNRLEHLLLHPQEPYVQRFLLKVEGRMVFIRSRDITYFESERNYIRAHVGTESYVIRQTMHELEAQLDPEQFLRVHRATIVNIDHVKEMQTWFGGSYKVVMCDGSELSLSRGYRQKMEERFGRYQYSKVEPGDA